jgi:hypothetical protein
MSRYASKTEVPVTKTKAEIEAIVERYGAGQFLSGWVENRAVIGFTMAGRQIKFVLPMPDKNDPAFTEYKQGSVTFLRVESAAIERWEQACRSRWRALLLVIKAKLEAVEIGISTIESEFLANIVMPGGETVGDMIKPQIAIAYQSGKVSNLLPDYSNGGS